MYNFKYVVGAAALVLATSALAGGPEVAPPVVDNSGFYVGVNGGVNFLARNNNDNNTIVVNNVVYTLNNNNGFWNYNSTGWNIAGELGYHWNNWRVGLEGSYLQHNRSNNSWNLPLLVPGTTTLFATWNLRDLDIWTVLLNGYYDFDMGNNFVPYVGIGLGWAHVENHFNWVPVSVAGWNGNWNRNGFAFQGVLGLDYRVTDNVRVGVSYHAVGLANNNNNNGVWTFNNTTFGWGNHRVGFENKFNLGLSFFF